MFSIYRNSIFRNVLTERGRGWGEIERAKGIYCLAGAKFENIYIYIYISVCLCVCVCVCVPGSSAGIVTGYGLDGPGMESRWRRDIPHLSRPALGPTQPPVQRVRALLRG